MGIPIPGKTVFISKWAQIPWNHMNSLVQACSNFIANSLSYHSLYDFWTSLLQISTHTHTQTHSFAYKNIQQNLVRFTETTFFFPLKSGVAYSQV